jgi:hypothetical protein
MKNQPPYLVPYNRAYEEVQEVVHRRRLRNCEIEPRAFIGVLFSNDRDLVTFALQFRPQAMFDGLQAFLAPYHETAVLDLIEQCSMTHRVQCGMILGVWFWSSADEAVLNAEFGALPSPSNQRRRK